MNMVTVSFMITLLKYKWDPCAKLLNQIIQEITFEICWGHVWVQDAFGSKLSIAPFNRVFISEEVQILPWGSCDEQPPTSFSVTAYSPGCCQPHAPHRVIRHCAGSYSHTGGWAANAETWVAYWENRSSIANTLNYRLGTHLANATDAKGQLQNDETRTRVFRTFMFYY